MGGGATSGGWSHREKGGTHGLGTSHAKKRGTYDLGGDPQMWGSSLSVGQPHRCGAAPQVGRNPIEKREPTGKPGDPRSGGTPRAEQGGPLDVGQPPKRGAAP